MKISDVMIRHSAIACDAREALRLIRQGCVYLDGVICDHDYEIEAPYEIKVRKNRSVITLLSE